MGNLKYYLIVFDSKNHAYYLESILKNMGYKVILIQAPRYLTRNCNFAIKIYDDEVLQVALNKLDTKRLAFYKVYKYYINNDKPTYKAIKVR